eukprot:GSChrysophyteH1.ASY1.ANO1.1429.1 assembled CDS
MLIRIISVLAVVAVGTASLRPSAQDPYYFLSTSECEAVSDQSKCLGSSGCSWCESGAVGSSCMSTEDASALPASVFSCTDAKATKAAKNTSVGEVSPRAPQDPYYFLSTSECEAVSDQSKCLGSSGCSWCESGAVGSSCMSTEDASALPASVFSCTDAKAAKKFSSDHNLGAGKTEEELTLGGGDQGVDISQPLSGSTANCFASNGISYVIPRGYCSYGAVDSAVCGSLQAAQNAGISKREVYMFPCPTCGDAGAQMSQLTNALAGCGSAFTGRIWLDIEGSQYWLGSASENQKWYQNLVDACNNSGYNCGVYSSYYQWQGIFGTIDYAYGSYLPLWYAHYDGSSNFNDFQSFGHWSSPTMKQYQGDQSLCGMGVDLDYGVP